MENIDITHNNNNIFFIANILIKRHSNSQCINLVSQQAIKNIRLPDESRLSILYQYLGWLVA
jgi:hypothetical protein